MKPAIVQVTNNLNDSPLWKKRKERFIKLIDNLDIGISRF